MLQESKYSLHLAFKSTISYLQVCAMNCARDTVKSLDDYSTAVDLGDLFGLQ